MPVYMYVSCQYSLSILSKVLMISYEVFFFFFLNTQFLICEKEHDIILEVQWSLTLYGWNILKDKAIYIYS